MKPTLLKTPTQYVTLAEAATLLSVSKATLRNWDKAGKLTAIRHPLNSYRQYDLQELKLLQQQLGLFTEAEDEAQPVHEIVNTREVRRVIAKLHAILRNADSQSNIINRFDEITKILFVKVLADRREKRKEKNLLLIHAVKLLMHLLFAHFTQTLRTNIKI